MLGRFGGLLNSPIDICATRRVSHQLMCGADARTRMCLRDSASGPHEASLTKHDTLLATQHDEELFHLFLHEGLVANLGEPPFRTVDHIATERPHSQLQLVVHSVGVRRFSAVILGSVEANPAQRVTSSLVYGRVGALV